MDPDGSAPIVGLSSGKDIHPAVSGDNRATEVWMLDLPPSSSEHAAGQ